MEKRVKSIIADYLGLKTEDIKLDMGLVEDLNINSYDIMSIVSLFEEEFNIEVPDTDIRLFQRVNDIVEYIKKRNF
ncbi:MULTISPECIES: acyl carrier protein [Clostridium]|uniref:Acyl carrier protein n=1 Tax=Clostridium cadaveris TaxID=1529 RepID=A0A316M5Z6_9CLOT|nr:acyl carrier protein [Clostridium cadaveris]MDU4952695.1 acyl carrier protein [Clostridium sp.]NME64905.1 acyl carrier protein [Clostridium cadaveris]PWL53912.1 MAG: acyl carrier protein [Clostridium cadaveris]UFH65250.1 acyl carrier protein [Clostridium cadaveris]